MDFFQRQRAAMKERHKKECNREKQRKRGKVGETGV